MPLSACPPPPPLPPLNFAFPRSCCRDKFFGYWDSIGAKETEAWRPWTTDGKQRMGGYVVSVEGNTTWHRLLISVV